MKLLAKVCTIGLLLSLSIFAACGVAQENSAAPTTLSEVTAAVQKAVEQTSEPIEESTVVQNLEPTATLKPTSTPTPEPTATPSPTPTSTPTPTPTEIPHEHVYAESVTLAAACKTDGEKTFICECGDFYTEAVVASGYDYVTDEASKVKATCTKEGKEADKVCSVCGDKITGEAIARKSHCYGEYVYNNDATMEKDGTQSRTCSVCGKVETKTAKGTKLPFDPYTLRALTFLADIPIVGVMTDEDDSIFHETRKNFEAGKIKKIRYIASNGEQFCMWNACVQDERSVWGNATYYWFMAPVEEKYSDGYQHCNMTGQAAADVDAYMIRRSKISGAVNESMLERDESIPLAYRNINSEECPVNLYEIVETDEMVSVWVESTNCGQEGIGTCGFFDCKQTCLRYTTLQTLDSLPGQKGWINRMGGECGRISWNGKLLVLYYYMKYE